MVLSPGAAPPYLRGEHSAWQGAAEGPGGGSRGGPATLTAAWLRCRRPWRRPRSGGRCACAGAGRPPSGRARRAAGTPAPSPPAAAAGSKGQNGGPDPRSLLSPRAHHAGGAAHLLQQQVGQRREELGRGCRRGLSTHPLLDGCGAEGEEGRLWGPGSVGGPCPLCFKAWGASLPTEGHCEVVPAPPRGQLGVPWCRQGGGTHLVRPGRACGRSPRHPPRGPAR